MRVAVRGLLLTGTSGILLAGAGGAGAAYAVTSAARAGTAQPGPAQPGPAQINALARPDLCWQAGGNGALVTLARCDPALQAQQWTMTSDGVLMTGTGYCLEAADGPSDDWCGRPGDPAATQPFDVAASWACDPTGVSSPPG